MDIVEKIFNLTCVVFTSILTLRHTFRPTIFRPTKCMYNPVSLLCMYVLYFKNIEVPKRNFFGFSCQEKNWNER